MNFTPLTLDELIFPVDMMLLPIYRANVVLGVQWMAKLKPILIDYQRLWMEFEWQGRRVPFQGVQQPAYYNTPSSLRKITQSDEGTCFIFR